MADPRYSTDRYAGRFPAVAGSSAPTDLSDWDNRPSGTADGEYGVGPNDTMYRWKSAISDWVPATLHGYTFTQHGDALGASSSPSGWNNDLGTGTNISSDGTTLSINTYSPTSDQERLALTSPPSGGSFVWARGYYWLTQATGGSGTGASGSIFHDDGSRRRLVGPDGTSRKLRFYNSTGASQVGGGGNTAQSSRKWFEYVGIPGSEAMIYQGHSPGPGALSGYTQNSTTGTTAFMVGDSAMGAGATAKFEDFRVFSLV